MSLLVVIVVCALGFSREPLHGVVAVENLTQPWSPPVGGGAVTCCVEAPKADAGGRQSWRATLKNISDQKVPPPAVAEGFPQMAVDSRQDPSLAPSLAAGADEPVGSGARSDHESPPEVSVGRAGGSQAQETKSGRIEDTPMERVLITIKGANVDAMLDLGRKHRIGVLRETVRELDDGKGYSVDAIVPRDQVERLRQLGYQAEIKEDIEAVGRARQSLVGKGNRFQRRNPK